MTVKDRIFNISVGKSRTSKNWTPERCTWEEFTKRCTQTKRTKETAAEYAALTKAEKGKIKDVGGFVAGALDGAQRIKEKIKNRSMLTLDIDYIQDSAAGFWHQVETALNCAALVYSSHSHTEAAPRLRLVIPTARDMEPDEYEPTARKIAEKLGINQFDDTTYQAARLMYWPSTSADGEFFTRTQDGPLLDPAEILAEYDDPNDAASWPRSIHEKEAPHAKIKEAGDPCEKPGIIGAFCRAYTIEEAIEKFLTDVYEPGTIPGRYTYKAGSSTNGVVCYDHKFAYSNHDTDPASRENCNAFDLVRIHKYGSQDTAREYASPTRRPSYIAMQEFAQSDGSVKRQLLQDTRDDFAGVEADQAQATPAAPDVDDADKDDDADAWQEDLTFTKADNVKIDYNNFTLILANDPALRGRFWLNELTGYIEGERLPWREKRAQWKDADDAKLRGYINKKYNIDRPEMLRDAFTAVTDDNRRHPIREFLNALQWDGRPRLDEAIIKYLGAEDTALTRAMTRKHLTAAVARVMEPGCKYDYCLTMTGPEGVGKSTFLNILGGPWFDDSITTIEGKEGRESIRGKWIIELAELAGIKRSEVDAVKRFLSTQTDQYRAPYAKRSQAYPRQCVFCSTTNEALFLKGDTGNRRFWVIRIEPERATAGTLSERLAMLKRDRAQIWAEAVQRYRDGEPLYLTDEMEAEARKRQRDFNDDNDDPIKALLHEFLNTRLPAAWCAWDLNRRRAWWRDPDPLEAEATETRQKFCPAEFICERLGVDMSAKEYKYTARKVNGYMSEFPDWIKSSNQRFKPYGLQRSYRRINKPENTENDNI